MQVIDISLSIRPGMAVYEGDPPVEVDWVTRVDPHDPNTWNASRLSFGTHTATHVDPPRHFGNDAPGAEFLPLDVLCGPVRVIDLRGHGLRIDAALLNAPNLEGVERVLLRTDNEPTLDLPFSRDYAHLTVSAAQLVRARGWKLIGIDSPSVEAFDSPGMPVHHLLLREQPPVVVVEGLDLRNAQAGDYELFCLPLKLVGGDGAPARAVLVRRT